MVHKLQRENLVQSSTLCVIIAATTVYAYPSQLQSMMSCILIFMMFML